MKTAKEILKECSNNNKDDHGHIVYYDWEVLNAMKEACKQQRKICANSAKLNYGVDHDSSWSGEDGDPLYPEQYVHDYNGNDVIIDRESIENAPELEF